MYIFTAAQSLSLHEVQNCHLSCLAGRIAVDECLRVLVTKHLQKDQLGEDHPDHGPTSVKEVNRALLRQSDRCFCNSLSAAGAACTLYARTTEHYRVEMANAPQTRVGTARQCGEGRCEC